MRPHHYLVLLSFIVGLTLSLPSCGTTIDDAIENAATEETALDGTTDTGTPDINNLTGDNLTDDTVDGDTVTTTNLNGMVVMGPVEGATVSVYVLNEDGTRGDLITTTTTDVEGKYSFDEEITGSVAVVVTGGTYIDEATGDTVVIPDDYELMTLLSEAEGRENVGVTALTTIASMRASETAVEKGLATAIDAANKDVATTFGLDGVDIVTVTPDDLTDPDEDVDVNSDETGHGLILAAFTQMGLDAEITAENLLLLLENFADDYSDGTLDGKGKNPKGLKNALSHTPDQALNGLTNAVENFLDRNDRNNSGIKSDDWKNRDRGNSGKKDTGDSTDGSTGTDDSGDTTVSTTAP